MTPRKKGDQVTLPRTHLTAIPNELGKCIARDALLVKYLGWKSFVIERQGREDFADLGGVNHPYCFLLRH